MAFISVSELADFLGVPLDLEDPRAFAAVEAATRRCQTYTGRRLEFVADDVVTLDAPPSGLILLPETPVTGLAISVDGTTLIDATDYAWYPDGRVFRLPADVWWDWDADWTMWGFGNTRKTVTVTYSHGFDPFPEDIKQACKLLASQVLSPVPLVPTSVKIGNYAATFGPSNYSAGYTPEQLLDPYRRFDL